MAEASSSSKEKKKNSCWLDLNEDDTQDIMDSRQKHNTKKATKTWLKCVNDSIKDKKIAENLDAVDNKDLPDVIFKFYTEARTTKNERYKNTTLKCLWAGLNRYIKEKRGIDIVSDPKFIHCNEIFKGIQKKGKEAGKGVVKHKDVIESQDMERLQDYFSQYMQPSAVVLQHFVMFNIMFYMCRRGRENFATMEIDTFEVSTTWKQHQKFVTDCAANHFSQLLKMLKSFPPTKNKLFIAQVERDDDGRLYIHQRVDEADKNHSEEDTEATNQGRIYQKKGTNIQFSKCSFQDITQIQQA